jgi:formamidopyrimidine-DNA glycosylase
VPELPDIAVYLEALRARILDRPLLQIRVAGPSWLRSVDPPLAELRGRSVRGLRRLGKRIAIELEGDLYAVLHLMIAGRVHWKQPAAKLPARRGLGALDFPNGTLLVTEAGTRKRATLHLARGAAALAEHDPGGLEPLETDLAGFAARLRAGNHTAKRALTDPHVLSGIGNAYSDEILHDARLSPFKQTQRLTDDEMARLFEATRATLIAWIGQLRAEVGDGFPERVTAFRRGMAVHGRYREPCPDCGAPVQRIAYAENEANYCARCQTDGKLLADRALSRLLRGDWPRTLEELELRKAGLRSAGRIDRQAPRPTGRRAPR